MASYARGVSGTAWMKLPPIPMNTLALPSSIASIDSTT